MIRSLYIHIPFCDHICAYCDFPKVLRRYFDVDLYLDRLLEEIHLLDIPLDSLQTIYIGGGTPSCLSEDQLKRLLSYLIETFPSVEEFTIECNPESLTRTKLSLFKRYGITRISLGVQSSDDEILRRLGRHHTIEDAKVAIDLIRETGFEDLNLDFIYGLEDTSITELEADLALASSVHPEHLSFYSLQIEEGTYFHLKKTETLDDDLLADEYALISRRLREEGYEHYEISNFALEDHRCRHNLTYWRDREYYAAGLGASGYVNHIRYQNTRSLTDYLSGVNRRSEEIITREEEEFEFLMLNLRLKEGISLSEYEERFKKDFLLTYKNGLECEREYLDISEERVAVKEEYFFILDSIFLRLFD